jgi:hypothetical protein
MHVALLALLMTAGAEGPNAALVEPPAAVEVETPAAQCDPCCGAPAQGCATGRVHRCWLCEWFGPMPQTCYSPRFGCYPGNTRDIHRYPAFHGYYYRKPYNYRHYFEYPWHAEPHEPLGYSMRQSY